MDLAERVVVVGTGLLGRGIATVAVRAGFSVVLHDSGSDVSRSALDYVRKNTGRPDAVRMAESLDDAVDGATLVVEAVIEDLATKQELFARMGHAAKQAILMSNSSSLPIGEIASRIERPERAVGTHWWNPPQLIRFVEVIRGPETSDDSMARATTFLTKLGKTTVRVERDVPGFVGNRLQHALSREAIALLSDGVGSAQEIDRAVAQTVGRRLAICGPLEEIDRLGPSAAAAELQELLPLINRDSTPAPLLREKVARGELGAKMGIGFLVWRPGDRERVEAELSAYVERRVKGGSPRGVLEAFGEGLDPRTQMMARRLRASLWREAIALVADGVCDADTVDLMACNTFGLRLPQMGPIETADFVGLDMTMAVHKRIFPSFNPSVDIPTLLSERALAGGFFPAGRETS